MIGRGQRAELRVGYQVAAIIGPFVLEEKKKSALDAELKPGEPPRPPEWTLSGDIRERNEFWLTRGPFELVVNVGERRQWKWKGVVPAFQGSRVGVTMEGAPEK